MKRILIVVAYNMSELKHFKRMVQRAPRADVAILLITFGLTVGTDEDEPEEYAGRILVPFSPEAPLSRVGRQLQPDECPSEDRGHLRWRRVCTRDVKARAQGVTLAVFATIGFLAWKGFRPAVSTI